MSRAYCFAKLPARLVANLFLGADEFRLWRGDGIDTLTTITCQYRWLAHSRSLQNQSLAIVAANPKRLRERLYWVNPTSPTEGVGRRQAAEILGMQLQSSALQGMSAQSTSRLFRVVIFGGG